MKITLQERVKKLEELCRTWQKSNDKRKKQNQLDHKFKLEVKKNFPSLYAEIVEKITK